MQRGQELFLIRKGFQYICMLLGVIGLWKQRSVQDTCKLQLSVMHTFLLYQYNSRASVMNWINGFKSFCVLFSWSTRTQETSFLDLSSTKIFCTSKTDKILGNLSENLQKINLSVADSPFSKQLFWTAFLLIIFGNRNRWNRWIVNGMWHFLGIGRTGKVFHLFRLFHLREWNGWKSRNSWNSVDRFGWIMDFYSGIEWIPFHLNWNIGGDWKTCSRYSTS